MVTNDSDDLCWWQFSDLVDQWKMLATAHIHQEKSHQHTDFATEILNLSSS